MRLETNDLLSKIRPSTVHNPGVGKVYLALRKVPMIDWNFSFLNGSMIFVSCTHAIDIYVPIWFCVELKHILITIVAVLLRRQHFF